MSEQNAQFTNGGPGPQPDEAGIRRLRWLARIGLLWAAAIVGRLIHLQVFSYDEYKKVAQSQQETVQETAALRGMIFDRNDGTLAQTTKLKSIAVNPSQVRDPALTAEVLGRILNVNSDELRKNIEAAAATGRGFLRVKRRVPFDESERIEQLKLVGVDIREETIRSYPKEELASHILGGVNHEEHGNGGIEMGLDEELEGIPGTTRVMRDVANHIYDSVVENAPQPGKNVWLTIDERLQFTVEEALREAAKACRSCKTGSVVVLKPDTGDILAMASYPTFNPNEPPTSEQDTAARLNVAIASPFEPGSVFKVITLSAALETTRLGPDSLVNCNGGVINLYGRVIHDSHAGIWVVPMRTVLSKSSNIGAIQVALQVGVKNFHQYITKFGFGKRTGIPLPSESPGQVFEPRRWSKVSIGSVAMGHEITTTTLQLAQAGATVANHGILVKPRIVLKKQRPGEKVEWAPVDPGVQVLRPENAQRMKDMMMEVLLPGGTGFPRAVVAGYTMAGKTGSAQIYDFKARAYTHKYNASFMGIAPLNDPKVVIVVTLNGSPDFGGTIAGPVFKKIASAAMLILDVQHDQEIPVQIAAAKRTEEPEVMNDAAIAFTSPEPQEEEGAADVVAATGVKVPNLVGKTMRDVVNETSAQGIVLEAKGSGIARKQTPAAGAYLQPGERLAVQFSR